MGLLPIRPPTPSYEQGGFLSYNSNRLVIINRDTCSSGQSFVFRFHLAIDTLTVHHCLARTKPQSGLSPPS
jgi:hypothetical protein